MAILSVSGVGLASEAEAAVNVSDSLDGAGESSLRFSRLMPSTADAASTTLPPGLGMVSLSEEEDGVGPGAVEKELTETRVMMKMALLLAKG